MNLKTTCGIYLFLPNNKFLICHPTNHSDNFWSLPKGLCDLNEDYFDAAKRELFEETTINLDDYSIELIHELPMNVYLKGPKKQLKSYIVKIKEDISHLDLCCYSMVECEGKESFPECDLFKWVSLDEGIVVLHEAQRRNKEEIKKVLSL